MPASCPPVLILAGPEAGNRADFLEKLRTSLTKEAGPVEEHRLYAHETAVPALLEILRNGSLFASARLVRYMSAELVKGKEDTRLLVDYARKPSAEAVLLLVTDDYYIDKAIEEAVGKEGKKTFWELFENEKERWVQRYFQDRGIACDPEAVDLVLELVQNNTEALKAECSRMALFLGKGARLKAEDAERYLSHGRVEDAFTLFARMAQGTMEQALETLAAILANREDTGIAVLGGLVWNFRKLSSFESMVDGGLPVDQAFLRLGLRAKRSQAAFVEAKRRYAKLDCERILAAAAETDARLRTHGASLEACVMELFIYEAMKALGRR